MIDANVREDAADCATYLSGVENQHDWARFDVAVDGFLVRNKNENTVSELLMCLAAAHAAQAPWNASRRLGAQQ